METVSAPENEGMRFARMFAAEPELTNVPAGDSGRELIARFIDYITADGADVAHVLARMEKLKFEMITGEKTCAEVLAETEGQCESG